MTALLLPLLCTTLAAPLRPEAVVRKVTTPPVIDGVIADHEWSGALRQVGLVTPRAGGLDPRAAIFWLTADEQALYLAIRSELPPGDALLTRAVPDPEHDVIAVGRDDSIELVIHPEPDAPRRYFHLIVNARGALFDRAFDPANAAQQIDANWRLPDWAFANSSHDGWWEVELAIPLASLGATAADLAHPWGLRIGRNWQRPGAQSRWENDSIAYEDVPTMPRVRFVDRAPIIQLLDLRADDQPRLAVTLANPDPAPVTVTVFLSDTWSRNPPRELSQPVTIAANAAETVTLEPPHGGPEGAHDSLVRVTAADGGVLYQRAFGWRLERPADRWTVASAERQAIGLQYAVYPSYRKLRARVDIQALTARDEVIGGTLSFGPKGGAPLGAWPLTFADHVAEATVELPELPEGEYEVRATLAGPATVPREPVVGDYVRRVFPWENNDLGTSDILIPPFTPILLQGATLSTVLRRHELGETGLWSQVVSLDQPLLSAPMRLVAVVDGAAVPVTSTGFKPLEQRETRAVTEAELNAGPIRGRLRCEWDYDGMMKATLALQPSAARLDSLALVVPLRDDQAEYLHACADGLRANFAGKTPAGEGLVWNSKEANRQTLRGAFFPYVWVGGAERGVAWFADNDHGMSLAGDQPAVTLTRAGGTLELRADLVNQPVTLTAAREMEFGLQATPVKPMPEQPVNWRRWTRRYFEQPPVQPYAILGSTPYYGGVHYDLYPLDHDLSIYEVFAKARETGEPDGAFVARWLEKYRRFGLEPLPPNATAEMRQESYAKHGWEFWDRHIRAGMRGAAGAPRSQGWLLTPYTNPRGMGFQMAEWPTFQDEWIGLPYFERSTTGAVGYDLGVTDSFRDAALWSYREMLTCFDGIYWDNVFLATNEDPIAGGARIDEQGEVHPSVGLWALRELIRRTAIFFHEQGRPVYANVAHMTNTNLVPVLAFANVNLDWEWQYGNRDFQDRFSPELTVAESLGRQCGNLPLILSGGISESDPAKKAWIQRTRLGVCLVHELGVWDSTPAFHYDLYGKLYEFGYGGEATTYNYWDEAFPLTIVGVDGRGLVIAKPGAAIAVVTDYGDGGRCELKLDGARLGLRPEAVATDVETGERVGEGWQVAFELKQHDVRVVRFE